MRILFIEDNRDLAEQLTDALRALHYAIDWAPDGQQGWEFVRATAYDLVLMDLNLPKLDGVTLCRRIRAEGYRTPILMLTAKSTSQDQVQGLDSGADDYIVKPVGIHELSARIRALLRRGGSETAPILEWGQLKLDPSQREVRYCDRKLSLTPKEYALLELMLRNSHQVVSRKTILEGLWSYEEDIPEEDTIKAHIKGLRRKLKAAGAEDLIQTIYGLGYRLNAAYLEPPTQPAARLLDLQTVDLLIEKLLHVAKRYQHSFCYAQLNLANWDRLTPETQSFLTMRIGQLLQEQLEIEDVVADAENGKFVMGLYGMVYSEASDRLAQLIKCLRQSAVLPAQSQICQTAIAAYPTHGTTVQELSLFCENALRQSEGKTCDRKLVIR
jgi:DNA-binding response OmpR family regulator